MSCASETIALHYGGASAGDGNHTAVVDSAQRSFSAGGGRKEKEDFGREAAPQALLANRR